MNAFTEMNEKRKKNNQTGGLGDVREGQQLQNHSGINITIVSSKVWKRMTKTRAQDVV